MQGTRNKEQGTGNREQQARATSSLSDFILQVRGAVVGHYGFKDWTGQETR